MDAAEASDETAELAMKIFMASWTLSFFALIAAYFYLRLTAGSWPPGGAPRPPLMLTAMSTAAAASSSVVLQMGVNALKAGRRDQLSPALAMAIGLGGLFIAFQLAAGMQAVGRGLVPSLNAYAALFWITAIFHALHVGVGLIALLVLYARARKGAYTPEHHLGLSLWTYYWHGVDLAWLCIFFLMFVPG